MNKNDFNYLKNECPQLNVPNSSILEIAEFQNFFSGNDELSIDKYSHTEKVEICEAIIESLKELQNELHLNKSIKIADALLRSMPREINDHTFANNNLWSEIRKNEEYYSKTLAAVSNLSELKECKDYVSANGDNYGFEGLYIVQVHCVYNSGNVKFEFIIDVAKSQKVIAFKVFPL